MRRGSRLAGLGFAATAAAPALGVVDAERTDESENVCAFDKFGDGLFAEAVGELDERLDDDLVGWRWLVTALLRRSRLGMARIGDLTCMFCYNAPVWCAYGERLRLVTA